MATATALTLVFENAAGRIEADPAGFVRSCWSAGPRTMPETQAFLNCLTQAIRQSDRHTVLSNQTEMPPFSALEQAWVTEQWLPQAVREAGYRAGAIVLATNLYSRLAMAFVTTNVGGLPIRYRSFDDEATATAWLLTQG